MRILYRRSLTESPAYTLNAEEVEKALQEGISITENIKSISLKASSDGWIREVHSEDRRFETGTVLLAVGSRPDIDFLETAGFNMNGQYLQSCDREGLPALPAPGLAKPPDACILVGRTADGRHISQLGDLHPSFAGNVVRALGSAKRAAAEISELLRTNTPRKAGHRPWTPANDIQKKSQHCRDDPIDRLVEKIFLLYEPRNEVGTGSTGKAPGEVQLRH